MKISSLGVLSLIAAAHGFVPKSGFEKASTTQLFQLPNPLLDSDEEPQVPAYSRFRGTRFRRTRSDYVKQGELLIGGGTSLSATSLSTGKEVLISLESPPVAPQPEEIASTQAPVATQPEEFASTEAPVLEEEDAADVSDVEEVEIEAADGDNVEPIEEQAELEAMSAEEDLVAKLEEEGDASEEEKALEETTAPALEEVEEEAEEDSVELVDAMSGISTPVIVEEETTLEAPAPEPIVNIAEEPALPESASGLVEEVATTPLNRAQAIYTMTRRVQRMCPNMHPELFGLVLDIESQDLQVAIQALERLSVVLAEEQIGDETTLALYHACGHIFILNAMMKHSTNQELQQAAMNVVWKLSSRYRASTIQFQEIGTFQKSLVSVGAADRALAALQDPNLNQDVSLVTSSLCVMDNLMDAYSNEELFELGILTETVAAMKTFDEDKSIQYVACDILSKAATTAESSRNISKLYDMHAPSILAVLMERFKGQDDRLHEKAQQALQSILEME